MSDHSIVSERNIQPINAIKEHRALSVSATLIQK